MKNLKIILPVALTVVAVAIFVRYDSSSAQAKAKPGESVVVFDDPSFAGEYGKVEFSHLRHKELFGQEKLDCKLCHMSKPPLFSMRKPKEGEKHQVITMAQMQEGKACGGCHNGKTTINGHVAFNVASEENCSRCHLKK